MLVRLKLLWARISGSLWFLPATLTLAAGILALVLTDLERSGALASDGLPGWILQGGPEGSREVLGAIAGGLITVTGVVFSVTIVALQLASSQYTPRILHNFTADRSNQLVLAVFIATFTYTLLVLRVVRNEGNIVDEPFVPFLSVTLAVVFLLVSVGFLIFFINHVARSIQIGTILDRVVKQTLARVEQLFPERLGEEDESFDGPPDPPERLVRIRSRKGGYLQAVDGDAIFKVGEEREIVVRMEVRIGQHVLPGETVATAWPESRIDEETREAIHDSFLIGMERTPEEDVELGLVEISDIGVRALSPSVNDPTTAMQCIDQLTEVLLAIGTRDSPAPVRTKEGAVHFIAKHLTFERAVGVAFNQFRHFGADNPMIVNRLLHGLGRLRNLVPEGRRGAVTEQIELLLADAREAIASESERDAVERAADSLLRPGSLETS